MTKEEAMTRCAGLWQAAEKEDGFLRNRFEWRIGEKAFEILKECAEPLDEDKAVFMCGIPITITEGNPEKIELWKEVKA